jgi:hypothetical protein
VSVRDERAERADREEAIGLLSRALDDGHLPLAEYDHRVAAVGAATYVWQLHQQLQDLPVRTEWRPAASTPPPAPPQPPPSAAAGRVALILGIASVPLSICVVGGVLGVLAVIASLRAGRPEPGERRVSAALIGRVFGIIGIALSVAALIAILLLRNVQLGP